MQSNQNAVIDLSIWGIRKRFLLIDVSQLRNDFGSRQFP